MTFPFLSQGRAAGPLTPRAPRVSRIRGPVVSPSIRSPIMGLNINVLIADPSLLTQVPPQQRASRLYRVLNADETELWDLDAPVVEEGWVWPKGANSDRFAVYEFPGTLGSYKPHFWAGEGWYDIREHLTPSLRAEFDVLMRGILWSGVDGEAHHTDADFFDVDDRRLLLARSPDSVRELAAVWERVRSRLHQVREPFAKAALPDTGWIVGFDEFAGLLTNWGHVLVEAARRGWCVVGLSE